MIAPPRPRASSTDASAAIDAKIAALGDWRGAIAHQLTKKRER